MSPHALTTAQVNFDLVRAVRRYLHLERVLPQLSAIVKRPASRSRRTSSGFTVNFARSSSPSRLVGDISIFYRYFNGHCSQEIRDIIPVPLRLVSTTRSSTHSHPFQVSLPSSQTLSHKSSFIPRTCNLWNVLPSSCLPESYNLPSFKSNVNKLDLISLSS